MTENPLLTPWTTPFGLPPFTAIEPSHFPPAFDAAMAAHRAEIAEIGTNLAAPSFANTIEALEGAGRLLSRIGATFFNLAASHATDALQQVERDIAPKRAAHRMALVLLTGSRADAFSKEPWVVDLCSRVSALLEQKKRLIGVCFGHQLIAHCLGAKVDRAPHGWGLGRHTYTWHEPQYFEEHTEQVSLLA